MADGNAGAPGALGSIRVLDLSRFIAGPMCAMVLADMGADVIKVERRGGEDTRGLKPAIDGESVYTMTYNRNKRGVTLDTRAPEGHDLLAALIGWADVVIENYRPGTMESMGFGYEAMCAINPDIILTSVSGFGQTGPYRERALFDALAQAMSGLMWRNGNSADPPLMTGMFVGDCLTAIFAAFGTMVALYHRQASGQGQLVDVALLDSLFSCLGTVVPAYLATGEVMPRTGNRDPFAAPANIFRAGDGRMLYVNAGTDSLFSRLALAINRPELTTDTRFDAALHRIDHVEEIEAIVAEWVAGRNADEGYELFASAGIPCGIADDIPEVVRNPQLLAREMIVDVAHERLGSVSLPGVTVKLSRTPGSVRRPPPMVGQHNVEVYSETLGLSQDAVAALREARVI